MRAATDTFRAMLTNGRGGLAPDGPAKAMAYR